MFEFFIALFGGLFYGGKYIQEKSNNREYQRRADNSYEWSKKIDFMWSMEPFDKLDDPKERWNLLESMSDDLTYVFGENWREQLSAVKYEKRIRLNEQPWGLIYHIALSDIGKVDMVGHEYHVNFLKEFQCMRAIRAAVIIEKNMKKIYPQLSLFFVPGVSYLNVGNKVIKEYKEPIQCGTLEWSCYREFTSECRTLQEVLEHKKYIEKK